MLAGVGFRGGRKFRGVRVWALAFFAAVRVASADPALDPPRTCQAANSQEAEALAEALFNKGEYQRAGVCYQAAGDMVHANLAFLEAAGPASEDTARGLKSQRDAAKSLFASVEHAFHGNH